MTTKKPTKKNGTKQMPSKEAAALTEWLPSSSAYPFVHVGAGVSAARNVWYLAIVLREPVPEGLANIALPAAFDDISIKERFIVAGHGSDSLRWVVATVYDPENAGPRANRGEATGAQWQAFNDDVDEFLMRIHARAPIAAVIRTVDDEYSTTLSPWHAWSCRELPALLPHLRNAMPTTERAEWLGHACDLYRAWLATLPLAEQQAVVTGVPSNARALFRKYGGALQAKAPEIFDEPPSLDAKKAVWAKIAADPTLHALDAFKSEFAQLHLRNGSRAELLSLVRDLAGSKSRDDDELAVAVVRRALATPGVPWPDTHWRPELVNALLRLGRSDEARNDIARITAAAVSYNAANWNTLLTYLDGAGRSEDADALLHLCRRYVVHFDAGREPALDSQADEDRAARVVLELTAPLFADFSQLSDDGLARMASLFENLLDQDVATDRLLPAAALARAEGVARRERRWREGLERIARGDVLDEPALREMVEVMRSAAADMRPEELSRFAAAALRFPTLLPPLAGLASSMQRDAPTKAMVVYRAMLSMEPPPKPLDGGQPRAAWLRAANSALIVSHAQKSFDESAQLADAVAQHARENSYMTHSAACSYAAVGRYDDAFAMAKLAVELEYEHLQRLAADQDLGPLLERDDFKALFATRKQSRRHT